MPVIAIISQKGGSGKTTLAVHLAAAAEDAGIVSAIIDADPQATATQWGEWRKDTPPDVVHAPARLIGKQAEQMIQQGAGLVVIDTPPHADEAASRAVEAADLVLIPCRPSAFDLAAIETTARLIELRRKPAFVIFSGGNPNAPRLYEEAAEAVGAFGLEAAPVRLSDRAAFRHATGEGKTAMEIEPDGKAALEAKELFMFACSHVNMSTSKRKESAA